MWSCHQTTVFTDYGLNLDHRIFGILQFNSFVLQMRKLSWYLAYCWCSLIICWMNELSDLPNGENRQILLCRSVPNKLCRYFTLKRWSIIPHSLNVACTQLLPFKEYSTEKGENKEWFHSGETWQTLSQPSDQLDLMLIV